jgi:hypothetical protein
MLTEFLLEARRIFESPGDYILNMWDKTGTSVEIAGIDRRDTAL